MPTRSGKLESSSWSPTARKVTIKDGSRRVLYKNPRFPGELRIRKMRKGRDGKMTASYVKPPQNMARLSGGGWLDNIRNSLMSQKGDHESKKPVLKTPEAFYGDRRM